MISIKQLNYALAVSQTRHFKKAAEQCNVSQSALSAAIAELESQLGVTLFERDNKKVLVTAAGQQLLDKASQIKLLVDDLYLLSDAEKGAFAHPITIGVIPTIGPYLLPKVLPAIRSQYPGLRLSVVEAQSEVLVEKVRSGEVDTAILALPYPVTGLHVFKFWQEDFYYITHQDNAEGKLSQIASQDIDPSSLMLLEDGHCLTDHALSVCQMSRLESPQSFAATSLYTLIQMVAGHIGTTLVPEMALDQLIGDSSELTALRLDEPGPHRELAFITRLNYPAVDNIELLMKLFRERLSA